MCDFWTQHRGLEGRRATARCGDGAELRGVVHAIDPESGNVVLVSSRGVAHLLFAHDVASLVGADGEAKAKVKAEAEARWTLAEVLGAPSTAGSAADMDLDLDKATDEDKRKERAVAEKVRAALAGRRVDAAVRDAPGGRTEVVLLGGRVVIGAPFGTDDVRSADQTVLRRVQQLLAAAAADEL